ncbi:MAG: hypothetical protein ACP5HG_11670 [Anaerolineae bacterium]
MGTARDIALIFLSLEALVIALIPLAILSGLAYGVYRLHRLVRDYLRLAQVYAQRANDWVKDRSMQIAEPFVRAHALGAAVTTVTRDMKRRLLKNG